ncbi:hypothetical protein SAMN06297280_3394 [Arsukibacterium tuosuense]|uniref:Uncharacterized protein n=1 Tax=Arsukibacterium tuosuense TaxID=1323745 RepID=A0A285JDR5_9GAMM|nr:hypothetical protein [Arsukibacterium tuosuense]SNY58414.1 hypothetical protein SAMN06297280_3394 [Arsukibacterium tuosuense]
MKLYAINCAVNAAIRDFFNGLAGIDIYRPRGCIGLSTHFMQAQQVKNGLLITRGRDDYTPGRSLNFIEGEIVIDEKAKSIQVIHEGKVVAIIRKATDAEEMYLIDYNNEPDDEIAQHVKWFKGACADFNKFG